MLLKKKKKSCNKIPFKWWIGESIEKFFWCFVFTNFEIESRTSIVFALAASSVSLVLWTSEIFFFLHFLHEENEFVKTKSFSESDKLLSWCAVEETANTNGIYED